MPEEPEDEFARLAAACAAAGPDAMFDTLAAELARRGRWHAMFDARLVQARLALGLPSAGGTEGLAAELRDRLEERSLEACREVGWPLLEAGRVREAWMYLRAAATPAEVAARLGRLAAAAHPAAEAGDAEAAGRLEEIVGVALWEGVDPALGIGLVLRTQGTCNAITAYGQSVAGLPAPRQEAAAAALVAHLHGELAERLAADLAGRGLAAIDPAAPPAIVDMLAAAGGLRDDPAVHVDVSHLLAVLRIARVSVDEPTIRRAWELACYGCRLPPEFVQPGEPPFADMAEASRAFYAAQLGIDVEPALARFRRAAAASDAEAGTLPCDTLVLLLWRLGRPGAALHAALERPREEELSRPGLPAGLLPSLVDLAAASGEWETLRDACRERGDEVTFAATLAAERHQRAG
jgi:hypothetical protein